MWYPLLLCKRWIEDIIIFPFIWIGRMKGSSILPQKCYDVIFFFPFYHTGGAEKVHAQIVAALKDKKALILFTRHSHDQAFYEAFRASGHDIVDISTYTDNKFQYWNNLIYRGIIAQYVHTQQKKPVVFNGHSNFAYKLSRWLQKDIPQIELIHSFNSFSWIRLPFISFYSKTIMISKLRIEDHIKQYRSLGVPMAYDDRIQYIQNAIALPEEKQERIVESAVLKLMYVGRATPEKRVHLAAAIANKARSENLNIEMSFVGQVKDQLPTENQAQDHFFGTISDPKALYAAYRSHADILLIPSSTEGLPLVMMEAMATGSIIIATPVGDIPYHIQQGINGYLFSTVDDEQKIIEEAIGYLKILAADKALQKKMSDTNLEQAFSQYGLPSFEQQYQNLIESYLH